MTPPVSGLHRSQLDRLSCSRTTLSELHANRRPWSTCTAVEAKSPSWLSAYSSVRAQVTLWGSCLVKKSSAAE